MFGAMGGTGRQLVSLALEQGHQVTAFARRPAAVTPITALVFMDLSIPRLIQHMIDQGIRQHNQTRVIHTALLMLGISALSTLFAVGNNILSVQADPGCQACASGRRCWAGR